MAITLKHSIDGPTALKKLGVPEAAVASFIAQGGQVKLTALSIVLALGVQTHVIPLSISLVTKLSNGTLTAAEISFMLGKASAGLAHVIAHQETGPAATKPALHQTGAMSALPVNLPKTTTETLFGADYAKVEANVVGQMMAKEKWPMFDPKKMVTTKPIKLRDATAMYQPVLGTSPTSRYFMVAASPDLRVAARYHNTTLSVRIEGPGFAKHSAVMAETGFSTVEKVKGYASLHLDVGSDLTTANKTLGAILLGLGLPLETPIPNVKFIKGVGA